MSCSVLRRIRLPTLFGISLGVAGMSEGQAQESRSFVVPATGYGVEECLDASSNCGVTVANALCNVALEFGPYEADKTKASSASWPAPKRYYVDCSVTEPR
jgi:hypothetical protein